MRRVMITANQDVSDDLRDESVQYIVSGGVEFRLWLDTPGPHQPMRATEGYTSPRRREIILAAAGAQADIRGAFVGYGHDALTLQLDTIHQAPHTTAATDFRAVLRDQAVMVWRGMIKIAPGAQGSHDFLRQDSLVLSVEAKVDSVPGLEIEANDVKASHGATAKPLDPDMVHYLQSRGIDQAAAESLLVAAFLQPVRPAESIVGS